MELRNFYSDKTSEYSKIDEESIFRYSRAIELAKFEDTDLSILDVGCKNAALKDILNSLHQEIDYFGVDITDSVFKMINDYDPSKFFAVDVTETLPFEDETFDYVFALELMEHVKTPSQMLQNIKRVLKPGGKLILSIPNVYSWNEVIANIKKSKETEGHISSFPYQILERLLEFNELKIENYCGTYTRVPFSKRFLKSQYKLLRTNNIFLSRSFIYRVIKN